MKIMLLVEQKNGHFSSGSLDLFGAPYPPHATLEAVLLGQHLGGLVDRLAAHGASRVHLAEDAVLANYIAEAYVQVLAPWLATQKPDLVLAAHTPLGRDLMPRLAARLDAALASDCTSLAWANGQLSARRPVYAGKATAQVEFVSAGLKLVSIRPRTFPTPSQVPGRRTEVSRVPVSLPAQKTVLKELKTCETKRPDVSEASVIVAGGRSLGAAENFKVLEQLADQIGAAVGSSRAAVDAGYRPYRDQVGQTGKVVSPQIYIACGISGAIQHLAGMRTSKTIIAINRDPEAPIFQLADYGIVGDLFTVVPLLTQALQETQGSPGQVPVGLESPQPSENL